MEVTTDELFARIGQQAMTIEKQAEALAKMNTYARQLEKINQDQQDELAKMKNGEQEIKRALDSLPEPPDIDALTQRR